MSSDSGGYPGTRLRAAEASRALIAASSKIRSPIRQLLDDARDLLAELDHARERGEQMERALEQACKDLQQAHNEVLRAQGCDEAKFNDFAWPTWTPQANTIRWAEKLLDKPLGKSGKRQR